MRRKPKSFKAEYQPLLLALLSADIGLGLWLILPDYRAVLQMMQRGDLHIVTMILVPVAMLFVVDRIPDKLKTMVVFWRRWGWVPESEGFSRYARTDVRIEMAALVRHTGDLPKTPAAQTARWYRLFKLVEGKPDVRNARRRFLMYRDMACLSLCLLALAAAGLVIEGGSAQAIMLLSGVLATQYLASAFMARWRAGHLIGTVLALHTVRKVAGPRTNLAKADRIRK